MKKGLLIILSLTIIISGCFIHTYNINNACQILDKRSWEKSVFRASEKWDVPPQLFLAFIYQESKFKEDAKPPRKRFLWIIPTVRPSSAYGYPQALDSTWDDYRNSTGKFFAKRNDFADSVDFIGWYVNRTRQITNLPSTDIYNHYLAYHEGAGGFMRGTYQSKGWLMGVAQKVQNHSYVYLSQMQSCGLYK